MIFIVSYNATDGKSHAFIVEEPANCNGLLSEDDAIALAKRHLQSLFRNDFEELIELGAIENYDTIACETLNAIDYEMPKP